MPNINRTDDVSQQKEIYALNLAGTSTGVTYLIATIPRQMNIMDCKASCEGLSGAPTGQLGLVRFIAGTGTTTIAIGGALTHSAYGTSGYQTYSLLALGNSLMALQKGDLLVWEAAGSNAAVSGLVVDVVLQNIADVKTWY